MFLLSVQGGWWVSPSGTALLHGTGSAEPQFYPCGQVELAAEPGFGAVTWGEGALEGRTCPYIPPMGSIVATYLRWEA